MNRVLLEDYVVEQSSNKETKVDSDKRKTQFDLIPYSSLAAIADAMHSGNIINGYVKNDWVSGRPYSVYFKAICRHLFAWWGGSRRDSKSGCHPLAHVGACILILLYYELHRERYVDQGFDDRELN